MHFLDLFDAHIVRVMDASDCSHSLTHTFDHINVRISVLDQYLLLFELGHLPIKFTKLALLKL